jgi:hypothetical protein
LSALLAGLGVGLSWTPDQIRRLVCLPGCIAAIATGGTCIGLLTGFVEPLNQERLYTSSLFTVAELCIFVGPLLQGGSWTRGKIRAVNLGYVGLGCSVVGLIAGIFSATRSLFIAASVSVMASGLALVRHLSLGRKVALIVGVSSLLFAVVGPELRLSGDAVLGRLRDTEVTSELRYREVEYLTEAVDDSRWFGKGLGSYFDSPIAALTNELASSPHIGILTPYQKGGIIGMLAIFALPLLLTIRSLLSKRRHTFEWACAASAAVYFLIASTSGGWHYLDLFVFGISVGPQLRKQHLPGGSRKARLKTTALPSADSVEPDTIPQVPSAMRRGILDPTVT